ncbi:MAG: hypothetical protein H6739_20700 [Alphaproteobacteria bacterium]|nr:hypothetical protein [Alphaproteobacteria bacterium]
MRPHTAIDPWPSWIRGFVHEDERFAAELLEGFRRHVAAVAWRYPASWFPLHLKDAESVEDLVTRVFERCACTPMPRYPFCRAVPFHRYADGLPPALRRPDDDGCFPGPRIHNLTFYQPRRSLTRYEMQLQYEKNLRRSDRLRWLAWLDHAVGRHLQAVAVPGPPAEHGQPTWRLPRGLRVVRPASGNLTEELRALRNASDAIREPAQVALLVPAALERLGVATQERVTALLSEVLDGPQDIEVHDELGPDEQVAVRRAVERVWARLDAEDRALLRLVAEGRTLAEILEAHPSYKTPPRVCEAVKGCAARVLGALAAELGGPKPTARPGKILLEQVGAMLLECLPEPGEEDR